MKTIRIPNTEIQELLSGTVNVYPKYSTQIINLANQNAQGTRAKVVGQMSDLIQEFEGTSMLEWEEWYLSGHPDAIKNATDKIVTMVEALKKSINQIERKHIETWVKELVITKTYAGLRFQEAIIRKIAATLNKPYRLAIPEEESKGIDGYINEKAISIKPDSYRTKSNLSEVIQVPIVFYIKTKTGLTVNYDPLDFE